jgi:hypothetical protein
LEKKRDLGRLTGKQLAAPADLETKKVAAGFSLRQHRLEACATKINPKIQPFPKGSDGFHSQVFGYAGNRFAMVSIG